MEFIEESNQLNLVVQQAIAGVPTQIIPHHQNENQFFAIYSEFQGTSETVNFGLFNLLPRDGSE